jgi:hypothetical protein
MVLDRLNFYDHRILMDALGLSGVHNDNHTLQVLKLNDKFLSLFICSPRADAFLFSYKDQDSVSSGLRAEGRLKEQGFTMKPLLIRPSIEIPVPCNNRLIRVCSAFPKCFWFTKQRAARVAKFPIIQQLWRAKFKELSPIEDPLRNAYPM